MRRLTVGAAALCCALPAPLFADDATPLDTVVITADRQASTLAETLAPVIVIDRETIERSQATDVAELLRFHAGLDVARNGGPGQTASVFLRGTESNHVLVLVDGVEINPGTIGGAPFTHIRPEMIERIEVVKGPRSSLYGSEAIGGVINIITRKGADGLRLDARLGGGSFGTREGGGALRYGDADTRAGLSVNHLESDGFPPRTAAAQDAGYDNTTVNASLDQDFEGWGLGFRHWQTSGTNDYLNQDFFTGAFQLRSLDFENRSTALDLRNTFCENWSATLELSRVEDELTENEINPFSGNRDFSHTRRDVLDWQHDLAVAERQRLTAGLYLASEDIASESFGSAYAETVDTRALYLQHELRRDRWQLELAARHTDHETFGTHGSWNAAWGLQVGDASRLSLAAGSAFRAPDGSELYHPVFGNPALEPETANNLELGWRQLLGRALVLDVNLFHNEIENLISFDFIANRNENIEAAEIRGIETVLRWETTDWRLNLEGSYQEPENAATGEPLLRRAERRLAASLVRDFGAFDLGLDFLASGPRADIDPVTFATVENPGYGLLNLTLGYRFNRHWTLRARLENLTDKQYSTALGFETADRSGFLTLQYSTD